MWYKCNNKDCNFTFRRTEDPGACPECGKQTYREATAEEIRQQKAAQQQEGNETAKRQME